MAFKPVETAKPSRLSYEGRIVLKALLCALPGVVVSAVLLFIFNASWETWITSAAFILVPLPFLVWALQSWITHPLRVASNVIAAIREEDYTLRSQRITEDSGIIVELYQEINDLVDLMNHTRIDGIEARSAIDKITNNIDVATLIIGSDRKIVQANHAARHLISSINRWELSPIGRTVDELNVAFCLDATSHDFSRFSYSNEGRRFEGRRGIFRLEGQRFDLVLLTDITTAASEQERESWKRLLRVLGHELNNSLAPIKSLSSTLAKITRASKMEAETKQDLLDSLEAISARSDSIIRFMRDYTQLAKLPEPRIERCEIETLLQNACQLYPDTILFEPRDDLLCVSADPGQLQQAILNLLKNATEAVDDAPKSVRCSYQSDEYYVTIAIIDDGPGVANTDNLFVPFYTTKTNGSGIGLAISKQIVESVRGTLSLTNREDRSGCVATISLPRWTD